MQDDIAKLTLNSHLWHWQLLAAVADGGGQERRMLAHNLFQEPFTQVGSDGQVALSSQQNECYPARKMARGKKMKQARWPWQGGGGLSRCQTAAFPQHMHWESEVTPAPAGNGGQGSGKSLSDRLGEGAQLCHNPYFLFHQLCRHHSLQFPRPVKQTSLLLSLILLNSRTPLSAMVTFSIILDCRVSGSKWVTQILQVGYWGQLLLF